MSAQVTPEVLSGIFSVVLSLGMAYIPGLSEWYNSLDKQYKAALMAGILLVETVILFGLSCANWVALGITCDQQGIIGLLRIFIAALVANQSAYVLFVRPFKGESKAEAI